MEFWSVPFPTHKTLVNYFSNQRPGLSRRRFKVCSCPIWLSSQWMCLANSCVIPSGVSAALVETLHHSLKVQAPICSPLGSHRRRQQKDSALRYCLSLLIEISVLFGVHLYLNHPYDILLRVF